MSISSYPTLIRITTDEIPYIIASALGLLGLVALVTYLVWWRAGSIWRKALDTLPAKVLLYDGKGHRSFISSDARTLQAYLDSPQFTEDLRKNMPAAVQRGQIVQQTGVLPGPGKRAITTHIWPLGAGQVGVLIEEHDDAEVKHLERLYRDVLYRISHSVVNEFARIRLDLEGLMSNDNHYTDARWADSLPLVLEKTNKLTELLDRLSRYADLLTPNRRSTRARTDLVACATKAIRRLQEEADKHKIVIVTKSDFPRDRSVKPEVASTDWEDIFFLLIENAIKYGSPEGNVEISFMLKKLVIQIDVTDDGIGIKSEDLPFIFEPLYRSKDILKAYPGSGMGLALVEEMVQQHGGTIRPVSVLGQGTTFTIELPIKATDVRPIASERQEYENAIKR